MSAIGSVVFSASEGYDAEVWDDSALIQEYDRAWKSSRELVRKREERAGGKGKKGRSWQIGEACRAVYSEDGEEYEGTIVFRNTANRSVTVRFHGYNNEEEVKERELMESLGQDEVEQQVEQARLDAEGEEEEEGAGDEFQLGDWCRAEWSQDGVVYEGIIESLDRKTGTAKVKFLGFGNVEEKSLDELFMSKGEEWRLEQENMGEEVMENGQGIKEEELHNLIAKNCPDLLANFGDAGELGLEGLEIGDKKKKKKDKKEKKDKEKKEKKEKKSKQSSSRSSQSSSQAPPDPTLSSRSSTQAPQDQLPPWFPPTSLPLQSPYNLPTQFPSFPPMPQAFPSMSPFSPYPDPYQTQFNTSSQPPFLPFPPQLQQPLSSLPPPPSLTPAEAALVTDNSTALHSMLMSWYMAGYHSGVFEGIKQASGKKKDKKK